jgi:CDGSH-type Zn-finger protein
MPNFILLDASRPEVATIVTAMLQAREVLMKPTGCASMTSVNRPFCDGHHIVRRDGLAYRSPQMA